MRKIIGTILPTDNPMWPPKLNSFILVQIKSNGPIYVGKILGSSKDTAFLHLLKGQSNPSIADPMSKNLMIVTNAHGWRYSSEKKVQQFTQSNDLFDHNVPQIPGYNELLYDDYKTDPVTLSNMYYHNSVTDQNSIVDYGKLFNANNFDEFASLDITNVGIDNINVITDDYPVEYYVSDKVKEYRETILSKLEGSMLSEYDLEVSDKYVSQLINEPTVPADILCTDQHMITDYVSDENTLRMEANKLITFLRKVFRIDEEDNEEKLYETIRFIYLDGYVHVLRTDIPVKEIITRELLGSTELKLLDSEYGLPIRHNVLKFMLMNHNIQTDVDRKLMDEAKLIMSQEYVIALTPEPRYQIWCLVRLIKLWFGDIDLQNNIRKIKVLVNQFRANAANNFNKLNGIRFMIGVCPRYGKKSVQIVLKKLNYYFSVYFQAIAWKNNPPSYFKIANDLIQYSDSTQGLKLYLRRSNDTKAFTDQMTFINTASDPLSRYKQLNK